MDMQALAKLVVAEIKGYVDDRFEAMIKSVAEQVKGIGEGVEMRTNEYADSVFVSKIPLMVNELNGAIENKVVEALGNVDKHFHGAKAALEGHLKEATEAVGFNISEQVKSQLDSRLPVLANDLASNMDRKCDDSISNINMRAGSEIERHVQTARMAFIEEARDIVKSKLDNASDMLTKSANKAFGESVTKHFEDVSAELKLHVEQSIAQATNQLTKEVEGMVGEQATLGAEFMKKQIGIHSDALNDTFKLTVEEKTLAAVEKAVAALPKPADGINGKDGVDGRDAIHLEVMPSIDPEKSYPRGMYAKHNGGLWRSFETTHGMRGWECVVEGIAAFEIVKDGERNIGLKMVTTTGKAKELSIDFNGMLFKGQFNQSKMYNVGDTVMYAGSLWHCNVKGTDQVPSDGGEAWSLCAKRGRDGKTVVKAEIDPKQVKVKL